MARRPSLSCSPARRIVLLKNFVYCENVVGTVIVLDQGGDVRKTVHFVPAISQEVPNPITHQELIWSNFTYLTIARIASLEAAEYGAAWYKT